MALNYTEISSIVNMESMFQKGQGTKCLFGVKAGLWKKMDTPLQTSAVSFRKGPISLDWGDKYAG